MESVLDQEIIIELQDLMGEDIELLVNTFIDDSSVRLQSLGRLTLEENSEELRKAAHSFKGSCANVGASTLAAQLRDMEDAAEAGLWSDCKLLLVQANANYELVKSALLKL